LEHGIHKSQKSLALAAGCTDALISISLNPKSKKRPGFIAQQKIANACDYSYPSFLELGRKIKENKYINTENNISKGTNGKVYEFPVEYKPPPVDNRLSKMHDNLDTIYKHGDDDTKSAIEMNLLTFRKTVENQIEMSTMKEEIENLKKAMNRHGS